MDTGWDFRREHLRPAQRSHRVIINGGDQPNVVPSEAAVWYYFREFDYPHIKDLYDLGNTIADSAAKMTRDDRRSQAGGISVAAILEQSDGDAAEKHRGRWDAEMERSGGQTLAKALQKEIGAKVEGLNDKIEPLTEPVRNRPAEDPMTLVIFPGMCRWCI